MSKIVTLITFCLLPFYCNASHHNNLSLESYLEDLDDVLKLTLSLDNNSYETIRILPMILHIQSYYGSSRAERSFKNADDIIIDCFKINRQPSLLKNDGSYKTLELPPDDRAVQVDNGIACSECLQGEVGIPRLNLEIMRNFRSLGDFLLKSPIPDEPYASSFANGVQHYYSVAESKIKLNGARGAQSYFNVWQPVVSPNMFSLSQLWISNDAAGKDLQTIESGWQVYPALYQAERPAVFIFYTPDNYASGCYNLNCKAFVVLNNDVPIGRALPSNMISEPDGEQKEILMQWELNTVTNSWWLWYEGGDIKTYAGYYPKEVFMDGSLSTGAEALEFGGESTGEPDALQMGSGLFADQGYKQAAYQRNIRYEKKGGAIFEPLELSERSVTLPCYTLDISNSTTPDWYSYLFFGGPKCPTS